MLSSCSNNAPQPAEKTKIGNPYLQKLADKNSTLEGKILYQAEIDNRAISFYFNESGKTLFILNTKGVLEKINYFKEVL